MQHTKHHDSDPPEFGKRVVYNEFFLIGNEIFRHKSFPARQGPLRVSSIARQMVVPGEGGFGIPSFSFTTLCNGEIRLSFLLTKSFRGENHHANRQFPP